jgi:Raf kinase inhibitor-like YbhB/YbcL family protein
MLIVRNLLFLSLLFIVAIASHAGSLVLKSPAFKNGDNIPAQFSCDGANVSPPLYWQNPPENTVSFALIVNDVDATTGDWVHWIIFNIPAKVWLLPEAAGLPEGAISGRNSWNETGYRGPCPPNGRHHYFFRLYALDNFLNWGSEATKQDLINVMQDHILDTSELLGTYSKE